jgi:DNA invertase Pin-like site-specific DNA recombinase
MAQMERRLIGQRTREAMAQLKARGVHVGRPYSVPPEVRTRIRELHQAGGSFNAIAKQLTREGIQTGQGGSRWRHNVVAKIAREQLPTRQVAPA